MVPCPRCGKDVPEGVPFCPYCGNTLRSTSTSPAPTGPYQPPYTTPSYMMDEKMERVMKRLERLTYIVAIEAIVLLTFIILSFIP